MGSETYHEPLEQISPDTRLMHQAITSLVEELEAIDWYQQRADACADTALKDVLLHNKDEEIEHASMVLEWIRRHSEHFDTMLRKYLFTETPITGIEEGERGGRAPASQASGTLGIGDLKRR